MILNLDFNSDVPIYAQIKEQTTNTQAQIKEEEIGQYALDILEELNDEEVNSLLMPLINETF